MSSLRTGYRLNMSLEMEDEDRKLLSHFLQLSVQRKIQGFKLRQELDNSASNKDEVMKTRRFSSNQMKNLDSDYFKAINIINELLNDRFDQDYNVRVKLIKHLEKIFKVDSIFASLVTVKLSYLINDNNINVVKAIIDLVYNQIEDIISNLLLPYSIKQLLIEKEESRDQFEASQDAGQTQESSYSRGSWWDSEICKELMLATDKSLESFYSIIELVSKILETYGNGGTIVGGKQQDNGQGLSISNSFQIDDEWKREELYKKTLKLTYKLLRICMINTNILQEVKSNLILETKNCINHRYWDYPSNLDETQRKTSRVIVAYDAQSNSKRVYFNQFGCLLPIEVVLCKKSISVFENVIKSISDSIEYSGKMLLRWKNFDYLNACYWSQFTGWLCSAKGIYLNRFISSIISFSKDLFDQKETEKMTAVKFVLQEELLRILASTNTYDNIILFGEIINILNKLGKKGNLYELRQEAINKFATNYNNSTNNNNNIHVDDKNESAVDIFPPIHAQKLRGRSTRYSYKRMRYDVDSGFYNISPQSVIEGVSWLFSTNSYSNVVDIAINNFLNLKIPSNLFVDEESNNERGGDNRPKKNVDLILNSGRFPWTNEFSPLDSNKKLDFIGAQDESQKLEDYGKEMRVLDDGMFSFNNKRKGIRQILGLDSGFDGESTCLDDKQKALGTLAKKEEREGMEDYYGSNEVYELEGLTNAINTGTWEELKDNSNSIKSILFSQIITSVLISPVVDISPADGLYKVSRTMLNNNQLMNVLKHGQLVLTSWELLLRRVSESEDKDAVTSDIENYGEGVNIAWNLLVERVTNAFEILFYKYRLLIRLVLNRERSSLLGSKSDLKMEQVFIDILVTTLLSETKELLTSILLITNISDDEYNSEMSEDYFVYLDNILYHDKLGMHNILCMNESSINNSDVMNTSNNLRNINIVFFLWVYNFVLEQRVKVIHNLLFRFYHLDLKTSREELNFEKVLQWLMSGDAISEENESQTFFDYDKLFVFCFNNFTKCISEFNMKSNIFLSQLKNLIMNTPKIPTNFLKLLFNHWIYPNNFCMHLSTLNKDGAQINNILIVRREYALSIFYELLNSKYPVDDIRKISYFVLVASFLSYNVGPGQPSFLDHICLKEAVDTSAVQTQMSGPDNGGKYLSGGNFFEFTRHLFSASNNSSGHSSRKINIQLPHVDDAVGRLGGTFVENLISVLYIDRDKAGGVLVDSHSEEIASLSSCLVEEMRNWNDIEVYGEVWMVMLSFILASGVVPEEVMFDEEGGGVASLFGTNEFIFSVSRNVIEMLEYGLRCREGEKFGAIEHVFGYFMGRGTGGAQVATETDELHRFQVNQGDPSWGGYSSSEGTQGLEGSVQSREALYLSYVEDLFSQLSLLYKYYCLRYPGLINCLFKLYSRIVEGISKYQQKGDEDGLKAVRLLSKLKDLYIGLFKEILGLFKKYYTRGNGNLNCLIKEYLRILDVYSSSDNMERHGYLLDFITRILESINFTNAELCQKVYDIFKETRNINIIIPIIGYYDLQKIKELLPMIINKSDRLMIKECIKNIVTNPFALRDKVISSSDLLLLLISYSYPEVNYVDKKKTVDIIDCCFELTQSSPPIFDPEIIASVIGKIVQDEKSIFPRTLGRTLVLSVIYLPTVRSFISSFVISSLIRNNRVWEDTLTWRGVKHCIQKLWCDYKTSIFPSLILLPQAEFQGTFNELIETNSDLRADCMDIIKKTVSLFQRLCVGYSILIVSYRI